MHGACIVRMRHDSRMVAIPDEFRARYRSASEIRSEGAIGSLFQGIGITTHGLQARLLAWPGNGFQTEAVHVLTLEPGDESESYAYDLAEEAILCRYGTVDVWLRDEWVRLNPGDLAYFPEGVEHRIRNRADSATEAILVNQICPPQFDLYIDSGLYNDKVGVLDLDAAEKRSLNSPPVPAPADLGEMQLHDDQPAVRAQNLDADDVRQRGALFNVCVGAAFTGIGLPMRLVLWPGAGTRMVGFNYAYCGLGVQDDMHKHPVSDECLVMWSGSGQLFVGHLGWVDAEASDVALAPCGVMHGHRSIDGRGPSMMGGFASPPQLDLMIPSDYYEAGRFKHPAATELTSAEERAADLSN